ncbi:DUF2157 domain-containing protein [Actinopolyspora mortivallis]|uniref:DUF2157 domain-containing protein n=1 Tax=Actinopolyspora mortivallis TaxID=33906 RepID=UPI00037D27E6|nr:DUF2157 domain-containing protein [Actinopolyspora mortivallis]
MTGVLSREQRAALHRLVESGTLTEEQAHAALEAVEGPARHRSTPRSRGVLVELAGYLGAVLVFTGGWILVAETFEALARQLRVGILVATTVLLCVVGIYLGGGSRQLREHPGVRGRVTAVLFVLTALTGACAVGVALPESPTMLPAVLTGLVLALGGYLVLPTVPGLLAVTVAAVYTVGALSDLPHLLGAPPTFPLGSAEITAAGLLVLGATWSLLALNGGFVVPRLALVLGVGLSLVGAHWPFWNGSWWTDLVAFAVAALLLLGFLLRREVVLLTGGLVAVVLAVARIVPRLFDNAITVGLFVLMIGMVLLIFGALGLRYASVDGKID